MAKRLPSGTVTGAPFGTDMQVGTARRMITDLSFRSMPWVLLDDFEDFMTPSGATLSGPLVNIAANADLNQIATANASVSTAYLRVTRAGVITAAAIIPQSTLAANDTNFVTWTITNLGPTGGSAIVVLAATAANTTQATGGTGLTAGQQTALVLSATAANLAVNVGDILRVRGTVTAGTSLASVVDAPLVTLSISSPGAGLFTPFTFKTAGNPSVALLSNTASGIAAITLTATSEAQTAGLSWGDSLLLNKPDAGATNVNGVTVPAFQCWFQIPTAITTAQKVLIGLGTAMSATATSITKAAAFQLDASMNVLLTTRDGTNTNNSQTPSTGTFTLTAGTWYLATINWSSLNAVEFWISTAAAGDILLGTQTMAALASTDLFQPFVYLQKASGTTTPSLQVDFMRTTFFRANMT